MLQLLVLLLLCTVSLQAGVAIRTSDRNGSSVNQPVVVSISTVRRHLPSTKLRQKRAADSDTSTLGTAGKLSWANWNGSLPDGAVSIFNDYENRVDFICKVGCSSGFYNPDLNSGCYYTDGGFSESFEILVNEDNFEILEWKEGSYGSVPQHSVQTCSSEDIYVGKNYYGLGKVVSADSCFYLAWWGSWYWYSYWYYYDVLTHYMEVESDLITDIEYAIDHIEIVKNPPKTFAISSISNRECGEVSKTATMQTTTEEQSRWEYGSLDVTTTLYGGIPYFDEDVLIGKEESYHYTNGDSVTEESTLSISVQLTVPPNYSCIIRLNGYKYIGNLPFSARLRRTYKNGEVKHTTITGTYYGVQMREFYTDVERCEPLPNQEPCLENV